MDRLGERQEWAGYLAWFREFAGIVNRQERDKLDAHIPDEACLHVLEASRLEFFLSEGYVRLQAIDLADERLSAAEVFRRYGGTFLEDVCEKGLVKIP